VSSSSSWSCLVEINAPVGHGGRLSLKCSISLTLTWTAIDFESWDGGDDRDDGDGGDGWDDGNLFSFVEITMTCCIGCYLSSYYMVFIDTRMTIGRSWLLAAEIAMRRNASRCMCDNLLQKSRCIAKYGDFHRWYMMFVTYCDNHMGSFDRSFLQCIDNAIIYARLKYISPKVMASQLSRWQDVNKSADIFNCFMDDRVIWWRQIASF